ncbi:MAG: chemotaxis protein CheW [Deltaproteobacteria bacterium]|nr:chemotaxis protein CheW [Deltaproteobacteria bacterium]MBF0524280.1 chemotaxis protein CheW [Deltaproteobacteria bacterium]
MKRKVFEKTSGKEEKTRQLVGFFVGREEFATDILMIQEIIKMVPIAVTPNAPPFIEGVINLRDKIIPVIDLRKRLNISQDLSISKKNVRIMIINLDGRLTGFIVDGVSSMFKTPLQAIEDAPEIIVAGVATDFISGVIKREEKPLIIINFQETLRLDEKKKLAALPTDVPVDYPD